MDLGITGRTAVITGASRGIGAATARMLEQEGARVLAVSRSEGIDVTDPGDYRHHRGGEDNGDAHFKNLLVHHQVIVPVTGGRLDLGPWQAIFYAEFDGGRDKRLVIKVLGE